jgi:hypothetical protein
MQEMCCSVSVTIYVENTDWFAIVCEKNWSAAWPTAMPEFCGTHQ